MNNNYNPIIMKNLKDYKMNINKESKTKLNLNFNLT
jgi:hypothetical protein